MSISAPPPPLQLKSPHPSPPFKTSHVFVKSYPLFSYFIPIIFRKMFIQFLYCKCNFPLNPHVRQLAGRSVGPFIGRSVCHNFLKRQISYTSILLSERLFLLFLFFNEFEKYVKYFFNALHSNDKIYLIFCFV